MEKYVPPDPFTFRRPPDLDIPFATDSGSSSSQTNPNTAPDCLLNDHEMEDFDLGTQETQTVHMDSDYQTKAVAERVSKRKLLGADAEEGRCKRNRDTGKGHLGEAAHESVKVKNVRLLNMVTIAAELLKSDKNLKTQDVLMDILQKKGKECPPSSSWPLGGFKS